MKRAFKIFVDFDKEERWLNQRAAGGDLVSTAGPFYSFTPIAPGAMIVRTDYRPSMSRADFEDYLSLFSDAGWQHLSGTRSSGTQYFAAPAGTPHTEIFSDTGSKAARYQRAIRVRAALLVPLLLVLFVFWTTGTPWLDALLSPDQWYRTPGIWEKQGVAQFGAFLFETPFVVLRVGAPIILVAFALVSLGQAIYQGVLYRRATAALRG